MDIKNESSGWDTEIEKSVDKLINTKNSIRAKHLSDENARVQYAMAMNMEIAKFRKLGNEDITEAFLNSMVNDKIENLREIEMKKSISVLIDKKQKIDKSYTGLDAKVQYSMAINLELAKFRRLGINDVTMEELNNRVAEQMVNAMAQSSNMPLTPNNPYTKQRGYTMIGILGLITCIATIGIIIYGYILFNF